MADAQRMLEGIGQDSRIFPGDHDKVRLRGLFRIRDWTPESVVRVALAEQGSQSADPRLGRGAWRFAFRHARRRGLSHHAATGRSPVEAGCPLGPCFARDDR